MMTRKDFELLAKALAKAHDQSTSFTQQSGVTNAIQSVASALAEANPRFDAKRFLEACIGY